MSDEEMVAAGIVPVTKRLYLDLVELGYQAGDKPEGLALVSQSETETVLAVINDNDFGLLDEPIDLDGTVKLNPEPTSVQFGLITVRNAPMDPSDRDDAIAIMPQPLRGYFQPDAIDSFVMQDDVYIVSANEGDARDYDGYSEESRVKDLTLDPIRFPNAEMLQADELLGRKNITLTAGDFDGDGDFDELFSYGARSMSVWAADGTLVADLGADIERYVAAIMPDAHNQQFDDDDGVYAFDSRSDNKGAEPEGVVTGMVDGRQYAFLGLERVGGVMIIDLDDPSAPQIVDWRFDPEHISPEGMAFVPANESPNGQPLLLVAHELSGTVVVYAVVRQ